jgi:surface antigen
LIQIKEPTPALPYDYANQFERNDAMHPAKILMVALLVAGLTACETDRTGQKEVGGALIGAVVGGLLGSKIGGGTGQLAATAAGTLLGGYAGSQVGRSLDRADRLYAERTAQSSLERAPSGRTSTWTNPDSGHSGTFTPTNTYKSRDNMDCRDYTQTVTIDGQSEHVVGTACRQADGTWRVANR